LRFPLLPSSNHAGGGDDDGHTGQGPGGRGRTSLGAALIGVLAGSGYEVRWAQSGALAEQQLAATAADLILLDLGLPNADGLDLCRSVRETYPQTVLIMVTARTDEAAAVGALDGGADDFVLKPFRPVELLARLRAHLRRRDLSGAPDLQSGLVHVDQRARRAWVGDVDLSLRPKEHELLSVLLAAAGVAVRRERILDEVWDENWHRSSKTLDVHVAKSAPQARGCGRPLGEDHHAARFRLPVRGRSPARRG
jgi:DNA-binding response OmpR family regulator